MIGLYLLVGGFLVAMGILFLVASSQDRKYKQETEFLINKLKEKQKDKEEG